MSEEHVSIEKEVFERLRKARRKDRLTSQSDTEVLSKEKLEKEFPKPRQKNQPFFLKEERGAEDLIADAAIKTRREIEFKSEILKEEKS